MAKTHRGKGLWEKATKGRGTCPICKSTRIKLLYDFKLDGGDTVKVCKVCKELKPTEVNVKTLADLTEAEKHHQKLVK